VRSLLAEDELLVLAARWGLAAKDLNNWTHRGSHRERTQREGKGKKKEKKKKRRAKKKVREFEHKSFDFSSLLRSSSIRRKN
jgi:hypothetical protein